MRCINRFNHRVSAGPRPGRAQTEGPGFQTADCGLKGLERDQSGVSLVQETRKKVGEGSESEEGGESLGEGAGSCVGR